MFEVIISNVNTGRVWRTLFDTLTEAEQHVDTFLDQGHPFPRNRRNYRVEIYPRQLPTIRTLTVAEVCETAA